MGWGAGDKVKAICFGEGGSGLWNRCEILFGNFPDMLKNQTPAGSRGRVCSAPGSLELLLSRKGNKTCRGNSKHFRNNR